MIDAAAINIQADLLALIGRDTRLRKVASGRGGEYAGPCPFCGGQDRLRVQPEQGIWWCRQCGGDHWQDAIAYVRRRDGLSFSDACESLAGGKLVPIAARPHQALEPRPSTDENPPSEKWQKEARAFCTWAEQQLWSPKGERALAYLRERRGLHDETIKRWRLGYSPTDAYLDEKRFGLSDGKKAWLSAGIVIPGALNGVLWYVKVRRSLPGDELSRYIGECKPFGERPPKYPQLRGSKPTLYGAKTLEDHSIAALVEGELDAMLLEQEAGDLVGVATVGSCDKGMPMSAIAALLPIRCVLLAYDTDGKSDKGIGKLLQLSARMRRAQVPSGKDVTDFWKSGGNLRDWVQFHLARLALEDKARQKPELPICPTCGKPAYRLGGYVCGDGFGRFWCRNDGCLVIWRPVEAA